jgi:hypothetical protein
VRATLLLAPLAFVLLAATGCGGSDAGEGVKTVTVTTPAATDGTSTSETDTEDVVDTTTEAEPSEASIEIEDQGVGQADQSVSYGLILRNDSSSDDAFDVTISVNILDRSGGILATDSNVISVIPAGETYYFGGETYLEKGGKAAKLDPLVEVGYSDAATYPLPQARRVRVVRDDFGGVEVRGEVENTLESSLSSFARISIVLLSRRGEIVGGAYTYLDADLPPGRRAGFNAYITAAPSRAVDTAKVSVENSVTD